VEAIRALVVAKRSARSAKIQTLNQIRHLGFTAPGQLRQRLAGVSRQRLAATAAALRPGSMREGADPVMPATKTALRILGRRVLALDEEKARIDALLSGLVTQTAPQLLTLHGAGIDTAAALLVTAGDNPGRLRSEAAWAHLCGTAPIPASSGKVTRCRLNRGGDRQANRALRGIVITRLRNDPRTQAYMTRRLAEGRSKPEAIRILKRYVAREGLPPPAPALKHPRSWRRAWPDNRLTPLHRGCPDNDLPARRQPFTCSAGPRPACPDRKLAPLKGGSQSPAAAWLRGSFVNCGDYGEWRVTPDCRE
jgi:hypothetical protein